MKVNPCVAQIADAYKEMADQARYRPAAPSDGLGNITVPLDELDLYAEAAAYAAAWWAEEERREFDIGCCNFSTRPATVFAIEAARCLCGGDDANPVALRLLRMAVHDLEGRK